VDAWAPTPAGSKRLGRQILAVERDHGARAAFRIIDLLDVQLEATVLPEAVTREQNGLHPVALKHAIPPRQAALLQRKDVYRTAACRAFVEVALSWTEG
jgi:hypothetical protein